MLAALHCIFLLIIAFWLWKRDESILHKLYWPALLAKCLAGIALGIIYSSYYGNSDTFTFFQFAANKADLAKEGFGAYLDFIFSNQEGYFLGEHRTIFFIRITSVLALITGNNYWITSLYYSLLSFFASWYLTNTLARLFPEYKIAACIAFLFFPSVVFWSSGVIKESLAMAALFFITALFLKLWMKERISILSIVLTCICVLVIFKLKYYYLAAFIPITLSVLIVRWISERSRIESATIQIVLWVGVLVCGFVAVTFVHPNFSFGKVLNVIAFNNKVFMDACTPDDVIHFYNLKPTWSSMLINSPWAFFSGLFRPFIWEANTIFKFITSLENLVLLILTIITIFKAKNFIRSPHRLLILATIVYCILLSIFLALSTPNFGTLARYGVGYLPFVVFLVFNQPWINRLFSRLL